MKSLSINVIYGFCLPAIEREAQGENHSGQISGKLTMLPTCFVARVISCWRNVDFLWHGAQEDFLSIVVLVGKTAIAFLSFCTERLFFLYTGAVLDVLFCL